MTGNKNVVYAVYEKKGNEYVFSDFVNETAAKIKKKIGDKYKVEILELPRRLNKESKLELVTKEDIEMEGRGEKPTSPRPSPYDLEKSMPKPDLKNLKLDVLEGIVY